MKAGSKFPGIFRCGAALVLLHCLAPAQGASQGASLEWLRAYAGQPTRKAASAPQFPDLLRLATPDVPMVVGPDNTLYATVLRQLRNSGLAVKLQDDRYVVLQGYRDLAPGRVFLWVDLQEGAAFGGFYRSLINAVPSKQLTLFSRQVAAPVFDPETLPTEMYLDLIAWERRESIDLPISQFFIGASGRRFVLLHLLDYCIPPTQADRKALARCARVNRDAAELDVVTGLDERLWAAVDDKLQLTALNREHAEWLARREAECSATGAAGDCRTHAAHARAQQELQIQAEGLFAAAAHPAAADDTHGYSNDDAGVRFNAPPGWNESADSQGVALRSPDGTVRIAVWSAGTGDQEGIQTAVCARLAACTVSGPLHPDRFRDLPDQAISGTAAADGATIAWRADLVPARQPVIILVTGPPEALVSHAAEIGAFQQGFAVVP